MNTQTSPDIQLLAQSVSQLSEALAASERRQQALTRGIRWAALSFIVMVAAMVYAGSDYIKAYAASFNPQHWSMAKDNIANSDPKLMGILQSLAGTKELSGALVKVLQSASTIAYAETHEYLACEGRRQLMKKEEADETLCFSKAAVEDLGQYYLDADGKLPTPPGPGSSMEEQVKFSMKMMQGTLMSAGQAIVDGAALVHRLRRDSDLLRHTVNDIGGPSETLSKIEEELHLMNDALRSVPIMAVEMGAMNRQMSVMSYSVGSTMGRMGNIMPW